MSRFGVSIRPMVAVFRSLIPLLYGRIPIRNTGFCIRCQVQCRFSAGRLDELSRVYAEFARKSRRNIRQRPKLKIAAPEPESRLTDRDNFGAPNSQVGRIVNILIELFTFDSCKMSGDQAKLPVSFSKLAYD